MNVKDRLWQLPISTAISSDSGYYYNYNLEMEEKCDSLFSPASNNKKKLSFTQKDANKAQQLLSGLAPKPVVQSKLYKSNPEDEREYSFAKLPEEPKEPTAKGFEKFFSLQSRSSSFEQSELSKRFDAIKHLNNLA